MDNKKYIPVIRITSPSKIGHISLEEINEMLKRAEEEPKPYNLNTKKKKILIK